MKDYWNGKAAYDTKNLGNAIKVNRSLLLKESPRRGWLCNWNRLSKSIEKASQALPK